MQILGDKTVISTTYQNVVETGLFDEVFVATDSEIIFDEITKNGGKAVMTGQHETEATELQKRCKILIVILLSMFKVMNLS
jgi:CMP-2-keto-3-deoxyoctulosonic acid synthetase